MEQEREDRIDLMKKDKTELIRNIRRSKRKLVGALDSIDALWPDGESTDKERRIKDDLIKKPIRQGMFMLDICFQIFMEEQNKKPVKEEGEQSKK